MEQRLTRIETILESLVQSQVSSSNGSSGPSWAAVAAKAARIEAAPIAQRLAVRVRMADTEGKSNAELLSAAKIAIPGAYAIKAMRSGDIEVMVPDQATKDRVLNQQSVKEVKILRQDYLVEIPGMPLSMRIASGKNADNHELIQELIKANKRLIPSIAINKIR